LGGKDWSGQRWVLIRLRRLNQWIDHSQRALARHVKVVEISVVRSHAVDQLPMVLVCRLVMAACFFISSVMSGSRQGEQVQRQDKYAAGHGPRRICPTTRL
jgi:hypothetical protein